MSAETLVFLALLAYPLAFAARLLSGRALGALARLLD